MVIQIGSGIERVICGSYVSRQEERHVVPVLFLGYGKFRVAGEREVKVGDFKSEYKYLTARGWAEGDFVVERLDNLTIYARGT